MKISVVVEGEKSLIRGKIETKYVTLRDGQELSVMSRDGEDSRVWKAKLGARSQRILQAKNKMGTAPLSLSLQHYGVFGCK